MLIGKQESNSDVLDRVLFLSIVEGTECEENVAGSVVGMAWFTGGFAFRTETEAPFHVEGCEGVGIELVSIDHVLVGVDGYGNECVIVLCEIMVNYWSTSCVN